ncbi:MAG: DsbE family thiol:disulfide interchange protein [Thiohalomonadaceae bacterium]|jgi:cytochrome c biogenesis protein CcmG/thiol:disulfide interchange protein DsbE
MKLRFILPLVVFTALIVLFAIGLNLNPREVPSPLIDKPAPSFDLPQVQQAELRLTRDALTQHPVSLLNVWASWCVACRQEHPFLMELARSKEVPIYGLNYKDERDDAVAWLQRFGDPYLVSGFDHDGRVGIDWGVYGVPETFIVDAQGTIRYKHIGPLSPQVWKEKLEPVVRQLQGGVR